MQDVGVHNYYNDILEIALEVLDRCTVQRLRTREEELSVAFNFEYLEPFREK